MSRRAQAEGGDINVRSAPQMAEYSAAADLIASRGSKDVLDWGSGRGHMTQLLRERGLRVTAFDYDSAADGISVRQELPPFETEVVTSSDPVKLPFADGSFDAILSMGVLEHVQDPDASLQELRRTLTGGGRSTA